MSQKKQNKSRNREVPDQAREVKVYGMNAVKACISKRPQDVIRMSLLQKNVTPFKDFLSKLATLKKAYHIVNAEELDKISGTEHHEGVCALVRAKSARSIADSEKSSMIIALAGISNPHNIGAIARSACHFGASAMLFEGDPKKFSISAASSRVAEGGFEFIDLVVEPDLKSAISKLKNQGFSIVMADGQGGKSLYETNFSNHVCLVMGSEATGIPESIKALADNKIRIDGSGQVESLNVASATSIFLSEWYRKTQK